MSKRFTDTEIWTKPWFMELTAEEKTFWFMLKDNCDAVGVWTPNFKLATLFLGYEIDWYGFIEKINGNIEVLENGKWWLKDFCKYQYVTLNPNCKPHKTYINLLEKHGLLEKVKGMDTLQEKELDKELDKEQEKEEYTLNVRLTKDEHQKLVDKYGKAQTAKMIEKLSNAKSAKGYKYKSDYHAIRNWVVESVKAEPIRSPPAPKEKYFCPVCKYPLQKCDDGSWGCAQCKEFYSKETSGKLKKILVF